MRSLTDFVQISYSGGMLVGRVSGGLGVPLSIPHDPKAEAREAKAASTTTNVTFLLQYITAPY